ncbi:MAG: adenylosuccinate lyase [Pseudomonadales bacterium]|nr:adenylosuccinate lyase [Pseudomonadales bacterium]MCP5185731.1 adenylosuccinate lyase [Pseudomonadales bacterium]
MTIPATPQLAAISAIDGRYRTRVSDLAWLTSEQALHRFRVQVEVEWFLHLAANPAVAELPAVSQADAASLRAVYQQFDTTDADAIAAIERTTNHDVKAVEYFVKGRLDRIATLAPYREFVHFACTSEDINNLAYGLMLAAAREAVLLPRMQSVIEAIEALAVDNAAVPMLSRTHGQPASPTTLGKEMRNFAHRLTRQRQALADVEILGKINGAVGNFNAHCVAYPDVNWEAVAAAFVQSLGLTYNPLTTQIEPHDYIAEYCHALSRFNQVLLGFNRDIWSYIAIEYFTQAKVEGETGSSTMPHKVNPIDFENSEGNLGIANALASHLADKLAVSRWQRDLSDSTVLRSLGTVIAHASIAYQAALKGIGKLRINADRLQADLDDAWEVLGEAVQTVMRRFGMEEPYEKLKAATRGRALDADSYTRLLEALDLPADARAALDGLTPHRYIGRAAHLAARRP